MALKQILLTKKQREKQAEIEAVKGKLNDLKSRESELEQAIEEAATEEEQTAVEDAVNEHAEETNQATEELNRLEVELQGIDDELEQYEKDPVQPERGAGTFMERDQTATAVVGGTVTRGFFKGMSRTDVYNVLETREVQEFLANVRSLMSEKRAITGAELTIPDVFIGMLRDNINRYSKLMKYVWVKPLKGTSRVNVAGPVPEAVWTEACAKLNELDISFYQYELDGYKVGGYVAVCNATLKDSDLNLASEILDMLGQSVGYSVDKAIVYGTGVKMPMGIVTRLAQSTKPAEWSTKAPEWINLSSTNITQVSGADAKALFADMIVKSGRAKYAYGEGGKFWAMNETTRTLLMSKLVEFNAAGTLVAAMDNTMPIIGGAIETLPFIPDGDIVGGYGAQYILVEREGIYLDTNDRLQWIEENTLFKGVARYDGDALNGEGFVLLNIDGAAPTTTMEFAPDTANETVVVP